MNNAVAVPLPLATVIVAGAIVPTVVVALTMLIDTELPPETLCPSVNTPPDVRPVSTMMFAAGPGEVELKLVAPVPPGEVIRSPVGARPIGLLFSVVKVGIITL